MKKLIFTILILIPSLLSAQDVTLISEKDSIPSIVERLLDKRDSTHVAAGRHRNITSHINLEFVSSANAYFTENNFDELSFKTNRVRLEIYGKLNKQLSYHFRQSYNRYHNPNAVDNLPSSIEYANVKWNYKDKFELVAGKQFVALAGYEGYVNGIKVREFSEFNNNIEIFQTGLSGVVNFSPTQFIILQVANLRAGQDADVLKYGLPQGLEATKFPLLSTVSWHGKFADESLYLMYAASVGEVAKGKNVYYLTCGNIYEKGPVLAYLDVLYSRSAVDIQQRISTLHGPRFDGVRSTAQNVQYLTFIANVDYQFTPKWNAYVKGAYENGGVYDANGVYDKGRYITSWNAQACLEWFPFSEEKGFKVFAHYLYKAHKLTDKANALMADMPHTQRASLGIQYIIPVL